MKLLDGLNIDVRQAIKVFFTRLNWQALSVMVAMLIFIAQTGYNIYDKRRDNAEQIHKLRVVILSEVENNLLAVSSGGYESATLDADEICVPLPDDDHEAVERISVIVSYLHDEVYFSQLDKLSSLPKGELTQIVKTYNSISRLRNLSLQLGFPQDKKAQRVQLLRKEYQRLYDLLSSVNQELEFSLK